MTEENKINIDHAEEQAQAAEEQEAEAPEDRETEAKSADCSDEAKASGNPGEDTSSKSDAEAESKNAQPEEDGDAKYIRLMAEFQNYKKRVAKEKTDLHAYANEKIVTELLEVLDNFERALASDTSAEAEGYAQGMKLIFDQLLGVLTKSGLEEVKALGEDFDPNLHNAVMTVDSDEYDSNKVCNVLQKGYSLNGRVIRPAMVTVAN
jgi:grpE